MSNFYGATGLIGGTDGMLDDVDGTALADGDGAFVITDGIVYVYRLNATSGAGESSPAIISPDANAGDKRWILQVAVSQQYLATSTVQFAGIGIGTAAPGALLDASTGVGIAASFGADEDDVTKTNSQNKAARIGCPHYLNAEELIALIYASAGETTNIVRIGGGTSLLNAATEVALYTAANNSTLTGSARLTIASDGGIHVGALKAGTDQANAGAAAGELYHDTDDHTVKLGV